MKWSQFRQESWLRFGGYAAWRALQVTRIVCLSVLTAQASQYSFHVNSIEQGPHSTANPVLNVNEGRVSKKKLEETQGAPPDTASSAKLSSTPVVSADAYREKDSDYWFRLGISAMESRVNNGDRGRWGREGAHLDVQGQLGVYPLSYFGFNAFGGSFSRSPKHKFLLGGEVHVIPLKFDVFGMNDTFELGVTGGIWNLVPERASERQWASAFVGAKATFNFGRQQWSVPRWSINTALRGNQDALVGDLGLAYRF